MKKILKIFVCFIGIMISASTVSASIAIPENNAKNSAPQSVNYCVTDFRRTPVRLQICSLQFALCGTAFFALFSGLAINLKYYRNLKIMKKSLHLLMKLCLLQMEDLLRIRLRRE